MVESSIYLSFFVYKPFEIDFFNNEKIEKSCAVIEYLFKNGINGEEIHTDLVNVLEVKVLIRKQQ